MWKGELKGWVRTIKWRRHIKESKRGGGGCIEREQVCKKKKKIKYRHLNSKLGNCYWIAKVNKGPLESVRTKSMWKWILKALIIEFQLKQKLASIPTKRNKIISLGWGKPHWGCQRNERSRAHLNCIVKSFRNF